MAAKLGRRYLARERLALLLLLVLGLVFFLSKLTLVLGEDDVNWLQGGVPTIFDQYRILPRLVFVSLHALFGPSAAAALAVIFCLHALNSLLVYALAGRLLADPTAALIAVAVFLINPLTLNTLTWIACLSYVLGATMALLALLAFWQSCERSGRWRLLWAAAALLLFGAGLLCTHEIFFLPLLFFLLGWLRERPRWGLACAAAATILVLAADRLVYGFERYGIEGARLFGLDFGLAYASSGLASGLALSLAYPLSFFARSVDFMQHSFAEPARWGLTAVALAGLILFYRRDRAWKLNLVLIFAFLALITPYLIRLYLTPESVNFDITYVLSGRVFYLSFIILALVLGRLASWLYRPLKKRSWSRLLLLLPLAAYGHSLWLYNRADFLGLEVVHGPVPGVPPRWNPYAVQRPAWLLLVVLAVLLALIARFGVMGRFSAWRRDLFSGRASVGLEAGDPGENSASVSD